MSNRALVQFVNRESGEESCVLYAPNGDPYIFHEAVKYASMLTENAPDRLATGMTPVDRLEVDAVVMGFLRFICSPSYSFAPMALNSILRIMPPYKTYTAEKHLRVMLPLTGENDLVLTHGANKRFVSNITPDFRLDWLDGEDE